eukprot:1159758-Pelagomonas_calceolata.AAC.3
MGNAAAAELHLVSLVQWRKLTYASRIGGLGAYSYDCTCCKLVEKRGNRSNLVQLLSWMLKWCTAKLED